MCMLCIVVGQASFPGSHAWVCDEAMVGVEKIETVFTWYVIQLCCPYQYKEMKNITRW